MKWTQLTAYTFCIFLLSISFLCTSQDYQIQPAGKWVNQQSLITTDIPTEKIADGTYYLLLDTQIKVSTTQPTQRFTRTVMQAVNQTGIDYISQLNLEFDPSYETLVLNSLGIIRDGQYIDKLTSAKFKMLQRETELANGIYNGSLSLNIIIDDMRTMDKLDYSYTITGQNPVYKHFSVSRTLNWSVPVAQQFMRVLWQKPTPLHISTVNGDVEIKDTPLTLGHDYQIQLTNEPTIVSSSQTPRWYSPHKHVFFSEFKTWADVVDWATPLYQTAIETHDQVALIAQDISSRHQNIPDRITAALKFAQDEVRYLGLEMGTNSHQPTPALETLELRYGDCKDKTVLLISLLKAMGITAYPALVNTQENKRIAKLPPSANQFDHVIVTLEHKDQRFWLDPTISYQTGELQHLAQPNYGYALIVAPSEQELTEMKTEVNTASLSVNELYHVAKTIDQATLYQTHYTYSGFDAINRRSAIARNGLDKTAQNYFEYYQGQFKNIARDKPMTVDEIARTGELRTNEFYLINDFWQANTKDYRADFFASEIQNSVYEPDQINRTAPLYFKYPNNLETTINIKFDEPNWHFDNEKSEINNAFFNFKKDIKFDDDTLTLHYFFQAKTDHIPANKIKEYLSERDKLMTDSQFGIVKYGPNLESSNDESTEFDSSHWVIIILVAYALVLILFIIAWRIESAKRPTFDDAEFYPISNTKFTLYSVFTLGVFTCYWNYRTWHLIKIKENSNIMPIARGIFAPLFYYSLFQHLQTHSQTNFNKNTIMPTGIAIVAWILLLLLSLASRSDHFSTLSICLAPLIWLPLVNYIQHQNKSDKALKYNSKWRVRNIIISIVLCPLLFLGLLEESYLIPSTKVIKGEQLWSHQVNFLKRQQLIPSNEAVLFFYSDAVFDIRDDGNGISDNFIFSYWKNEQGHIESSMSHFEDVKEVEVNYSKNKLTNTTINVITNDGNDFLLFVDPDNGQDKRLVQQIKQRINQ